MPFSLDQVVPWGRSFDEYCRMFDLSGSDLARSILGCGDGPAAFNAELTRRGGTIVSCDPLYAVSAQEIEARIHGCLETVLDQVRQHAEEFVWSSGIPDVETLGQVRMTAMQQFLNDFHPGKSQGRYVTGELPTLPFSDARFDLAICSHFLFLYESTGCEFHTKSVLELTRVAREVRIFPIVQLDGQESKHLSAVLESVAALGYVAEVVSVAYEFQRGADKMLRILCPAG